MMNVRGAMMNLVSVLSKSLNFVKKCVTVYVLIGVGLIKALTIKVAINLVI